jgi:L-threonylcarbamoyladenylate synthase
VKLKISKFIKCILNGEPVIVPTDTVYGLVCRYDSKRAVNKIYKLKKRDRKKPLILLGYNWQSLKKFINLKQTDSAILRKHIKKWPGSLTLVLPGSRFVPKFLNKGFKTIGLRIPKNKFLLEALKHCPDRVLASTSANISGQKDVNGIAKKVRLFIKAKKGEMSNKPSRIIGINGEKIKIFR